MSVELKQSPPPRGRAAPPVAAWKIAAARASIAFEHVWPALLTSLAPVALIAIAGLFGAWLEAPQWLHLGALLAAALFAGAAFWRNAGALRWPPRDAALARLEADGRLAHAPLRALEDRPFAAEGASPLWRAHLADMAKKARSARLKGPRAVADARDPFSLRYGAIGLLAVGLVAAGPDWGRRLAQSFNPSAGAAARVAEVDLWIEPPAYAGKAPIYLLRSGDRVAGVRAQIDAPEGSTVVAQVSAAGSVRLRLAMDGATLEAAPDMAQSGRYALTLDRSGLLRLKVGAAEGRWPIGVLKDEPPAVHFVDDPSITDDARIALAIFAEDDYGIAAARLELRLDPDQDRPIDSPQFDVAAVRDRRRIDLEGAAGKPGARRLDVDLQADPWAGLAVYARIAVIDGAGQEGASEEARLTLPVRPFFNPLARAVIEQRQTLAVAAQDWPRAGRSLDALTLAPDRFYDDSADYLLMRAAFWRVMRQDGEGFGETVAEFWPLALQLEDEALELARQRLEAAQEKLREALERGADDETISRRVEELRAAMQQYLAALQQSGARGQEGGASAETLEAGDLEDMLDSIRDLSQSGAKGAARQALSDLEDILKNLRMSSRGGGPGGPGGEGAGSGGAGGLTGQAGDLIGRQRDLANRSFERGLSPGPAGGDLAGEQSGLAGDLTKLLEGLGEGGTKADPEGEGRRALEQALNEMSDAEEALRSDNFDAAGTAMERAIGNLREGAGALAEAQGREGRDAMGETGGASGPSLDPLGRPFGEAYGRGVDVPEGWDAQAAREVLQELRRRLSQGERTEDEIRYLERLLERF